jgi:hypothetical protein
LNALDDIRNCEDKFKTAQDKKAQEEAADHLHTTVEMMIKLMLPHLEEEERVISPILRAEFTQPEEKQTIDKILASLSLEDNINMLPWIADSLGKWAPDDIVAKFMSNLPKPIVFALNNFWLPAFQLVQPRLFACLFLSSSL